MIRVDFDEVSWDDDSRVVHNGVWFTGEVVEKTRSGEIVAVTSYWNGVEDGQSTEWYPSGQLKARGVARYGQAVGAHQVWHPNGQLATEAVFDDEGHQLSRRAWDEAGNLIADSAPGR